MPGSKTQFDIFLEEEVKKYDGVAVPIRTSLLKRLLIKSTNPGNIHPNPQDEFCFPDIGPNYKIISDYENKINQAEMSGTQCFSEPLIVEQILPDGYMLLNGHHRWAAALRRKLRKVPIRIVNVTREADIREMFRNSKHEKRVTLDLDELVFVSDENDTVVEKPLPFFLRLRYKERLRRGIPALFNYLKTQGYDIWVYSAQFYSIDYIRHLFLFYHVLVDGMVTGTGRKRGAGLINVIEKLSENKYSRTIHIDNESVVCINSVTKEFEDFRLSGSPDVWSQEIMSIIGDLEKNER